MFNFLKNKLSKIYNSLHNRLQTLFTKSAIDENNLKELEQLLLEADVGIKTTNHLLQIIETHAKKNIMTGSALKTILHHELIRLLKPMSIENTHIFLLVGINGSGKTTAAGKLAYNLKQQNKKVLLVGADTFRAAASEQLEQWARVSEIDIVRGTPAQDPSAVIFTACQRYKQKSFDTLIIDTAGRLQTKINLMHELAKMKRIVEKQLPDKKILTLLTIDAILGQNSFEQAKLFNECTKIDGILLTKLDGTSKGGIVFAINHELNIPVFAISYGEQITDLKTFDAKTFVTDLLQ